MLQVIADEARARERLSELMRDFTLPEGHRIVETFLERVEVGELALYMTGLVAEGAGTVTGSAAGMGGFPIDRAYFELLERLCIVLARDATGPLGVRSAQGARRRPRAATTVFPVDRDPDRVRASVSNGVALHESWPQACEAALDEMVERDRVLRSFAGEFAPRSVVHPTLAAGDALDAHYDVRAYAMDPPGVELERNAAGVFLFPRVVHAPLCYGFGAARAPDAALASAEREALQRLAFLWGEELPHRPPDPTPTPDFHQDFYLYPPHREHLERWLSGARTAGPHSTATRPFDGQAVTFADLTHAALRGRLVVVRALSRTARALRFGATVRSLHTPPHPVA